jgi:hypothetical protein
VSIQRSRGRSTDTLPTIEASDALCRLRGLRL